MPRGHFRIPRVSPWICAIALILLVSAIVACAGSDATDTPPKATADATPTAESATPTAESATPTAESATPTAESATPTAESATPTAGSATPTAGSATPTAGSATPTAESATPRILLAKTSAETDREVLTTLYNTTGGDEWDDHDGWLSDAPLSEWDGVKTDDEDRVVHLSIDSNWLSGEIPPELGNLANLTELYLQENQLSGCVPPELGNLANLKAVPPREPVERVRTKRYARPVE